LLRLTDVFVAEEDGIFAGLCFSADMGRHWSEIAALLVLPHFQGRGLGNALFSAAWDRAWRRGRHIYVLSRNLQVVGWMEARGMEVGTTGWKLPGAVHWHLARHMASGHRWREGFRKRQAIRACPPLIQGIKRQW
jgi:GNAT superfamily N-acetyltransferase